MDTAKNQLGKIGTVLVLASVGVTLYWALTYSGPYRSLAELQLKWFGVYYPEITAIVIILGFVGIAGVIKLLFRGAEKPVPGAQTTATLAPTFASAAQGQWLFYIRYAFLLVPFGLGIWMYYNGTHAGALQQLSAVDFQDGNLKAHVLYADVRGHLKGPYLSKDHYRYIPMTSEENGSGPVQLVVGIDENQMQKYMRREPDGTFSVRGVADKGLEGDVKYAFEKNGISVADPVWIVHAGRDPKEDKMFGLIMIGIGFVFVALVWGKESYRQRKEIAPRPLQASPAR
jgi:hypothetical protein